MGFRIHRSKQIMPGVRLNMSKSGFGISVGKPGARVSINPKGEVKTTIGIPGTGISHSQKVADLNRKSPANKTITASVNSQPSNTSASKSNPVITTKYLWIFAAIIFFGIAFCTFLAMAA